MSRLQTVLPGLLTLIMVNTSDFAHCQGRNYIGNYSQAQQFYSDANGRPLFFKVEYVIDGTPYHPMTYYYATVVLGGGAAYTNVPVKFNLMENLVIYKTPMGQELVATTPIMKIIFTDSSDYGHMYKRIYERGFSSIEGHDANTIYEVLDSGKVTLLKHHHVFYNDKKEYGSASITRIFGERVEYFVAMADGSTKKLEKGTNEILTLLSDKKQLVTRYILDEGLKCKKEDDWLKVIRYYNSLQ
jgi:hypothetical protein